MPASTLKTEIDRLEQEFRSGITDVRDVEGLERLRVRFLGRKGVISELFESFASLPPDGKREAGKLLNTLKQKVQEAIQEKSATHASAAATRPGFDHTLPANIPPIGRIHPITEVLRRIKACFANLGFSVAQGPEVETDYYNFEALNIPKGHPARDMQDTLYVDDAVVLRTHTSPVQVRVMEQQKPPIRIIAPGRCYRRDTPDATHSPVFHQVEGLCVDEGIGFADLKGVILAFARAMFGSDMKIRFRPSFFPFTEPSAEYDFTCMICRGRGCRVCHDTGWVEISGAGMVNPEVFRFAGIDPERYTGYAFGMGVERIAMLLYEVHDIRMFYENDARFLHQF
jgi:phenylalanyl-tRNA synthetase alpha chain